MSEDEEILQKMGKNPCWIPCGFKENVRELLKGRSVDITRQELAWVSKLGIKAARRKEGSRKSRDLCG